MGLASLHVYNEKNSSKEIIMVDPLEAKRLAAVQLQQLQAKERLKVRIKSNLDTDHNYSKSGIL